MHPSIRQQVARGLAAAGTLAWALAWGVPALASLVTGIDLHHHTTPLGEWLRGFVPLRENTFACLRDLAVAAVPGAALLALGRSRPRARAARAWNPVPLLLTLMGIEGARMVLLMGAVDLDLWSRPYAVMMDAVPAALSAAALVVLLRRLGPVREWGAGALLSVGTLAAATVAPLISGLAMYWMMFGPRPIPNQPALALGVLHWPVVLGLAALACRWVSTRPGRKPRGAYALAVLAGFAFPWC